MILNQHVSMDEGTCPQAQSTALVPQGPNRQQWAPDPILAEHLTRLAAASGASPPQILPGAAVHLMSVELPLKTARQRRAALPFAVEDHVAAPIEHCQLALGPAVANDRYLCAIADRNWLEEALRDDRSNAPVVPDLIAVPPPFDPDAWSLWCSEDLTYLRFFDGGGLVLRQDALPAIWRARGQPELHLWHGAKPVGVRIARQIDDDLHLNPQLLKMDLRPHAGRSVSREWRSLGRFCGILAAAAMLLQAGLLQLDAAALRGMAVDRQQIFQAQLSSRVGDIAHASQPTGSLLAILAQASESPQTDNSFLALLAGLAAALPQGSALQFRSLRFDHEPARLSVLIEGPNLDALQDAENRLGATRLGFTSGAATRTSSGAEMEIIIEAAR